VKSLRLAIVILLGLILVAVPLLGACGEEVTPPGEEEEEGPPVEEEEEEEALPGEPIIIRWQSSSGATTGSLWELMEETAEAVETKTEGRVIVELYPGGALCPFSEVVDGIRTGIIDIGWVDPGTVPGLLPKTELIAIPLVWPLEEGGIMMNEDLFPKYIAPEWEAAGLIMLRSVNDRMYSNFFSTDKILQSFDDFRGVVIATSNERDANILRTLGFSPTIMPVAEIYLSLEKGVVEAAMMTNYGAQLSKYPEVCHYVTIADIGSSRGIGLAGNPECFENMPADIAEIVEQEFVTFSQKRYELEPQWSDEAMQVFIEAGMEVITLPEDVRSLMVEKAQSLIEEWILTQENAGMEDARQFAEYCLNLREEVLAELAK
jgi:TRAP-type C4-dicarboxylate transport system substrate-binding protein